MIPMVLERMISTRNPCILLGLCYIVQWRMGIEAWQVAQGSKTHFYTFEFWQHILLNLIIFSHSRHYPRLVGGDQRLLTIWQIAISLVERWYKSRESWHQQSWHHLPWQSFATASIVGKNPCSLAQNLQVRCLQKHKTIWNFKLLQQAQKSSNLRAIKCSRKLIHSSFKLNKMH